MPKRIPHTDLEIITGEQTTQDYLKMQKKFGKFYFRDFFSRFDQIKKTGRFLEIGPGPGYQTCLVSKRYNPEKIIGLEYSPDMIKVAEEYTHDQRLDSKVTFVKGAVEDTELIKGLGTFDVVYSTFSLHHWTNPSTGIRNLYNCLNENGVIYIYDFFRGGIFYYLKIKRGIWESIRASYRPEEIADMLKRLDINNYSLEKKGLYMAFIIRK
ncbi:MAG: class I SAM-dependent methyltransferase [Desulfobacteraceae bacterium]|jgi:ubiquinone/menaquinone biosynthesis C-methylase UbiE